jgi:hypothetical protein
MKNSPLQIFFGDAMQAGLNLYRFRNHGFEGFCRPALTYQLIN